MSPERCHTGSQEFKLLENKGLFLFCSLLHRAAPAPSNAQQMAVEGGMDGWMSANSGLGTGDTVVTEMTRPLLHSQLLIWFLK